MSQKLNRRNFLKLAGATGATALVAGGVSHSITSAQEPAPIPKEAAEAFQEFCGIPDPIIGPFNVDGVDYPYPDPETGEMFYHDPIRELPRLGTSRTPLTEPVNLLENLPERIESQDGILEMDLEAAFGEVVVNGQQLNVRTYNGSVPGPTLVAKPGDALKIRHLNNMPPEPNVPHENINHPHGFNTINLHTHGINGSSIDNEDNVLLNILPGTAFDYEIFLHENHPTGTFWYHPHKHGSTSNHVGSGMAGFLIIEDGETDIRAVPEIGAAKEVPLMLQEIYIQDNEDGTGFVPDWPTPDMGFYYGGAQVRLETTINGFACNELQENGEMLVPEIHMRPGEVQHWRFSHGGIFVVFTLAIEGHEMHIVSNDGITMDAPETTNEFLIASGNRRDILVKASMEPGTYAVKRTRYKQSPQLNTWPEKTLFNIVVSGEPNDMPLPTTLNPPVENLPYIADEEVVAERKIDMQFVASNTAGIFLHLIDRKVFDPTHVDFCMVKDTAETWHICNGLSSDHPFHIHVNWFEIHKIVDRYGNETVYDPPRWADNVLVPRQGYATVRHRFHKFQGLSVLHCHILPHEDEGMMSLIEIVDGEPKTEVIDETGGRLFSPEYDARVQARFLEHAFDSEAEVTYQFNASPNEPTVNTAPPLNEGMADYNRFFSLTATQDGEAVAELNRAATITVSYSPGQPRTPAGKKMPLSEIKLYHYDEEAQTWSAEGISVISQSEHAVTCSTRKLGRFALSGMLDTCYDVNGDGVVDTADIAIVSQFMNTPYNYFKGLYDFTGDDAVNGDDIEVMALKANDFFEGPYCRE